MFSFLKIRVLSSVLVLSLLFSANSLAEEINAFSVLPNDRLLSNDNFIEKNSDYYNCST